LGNFPWSQNFFGKQGEIWNRGEMHHCLRGDGRPCMHGPGCWRQTFAYWTTCHMKPEHDCRLQRQSSRVLQKEIKSKSNQIQFYCHVCTHINWHKKRHATDENEPPRRAITYQGIMVDYNFPNLWRYTST